MVLNAAVQAFRQAEELKQKVLLNIGTTPTPSEQTLMLAQLQKAYKSILLMDLDYALDKKVEQDLWNLGFKNQIETQQNNAKDKKNPKRAENQTMLSWVLQSATGFYVCLLHQICTAFKLILPFRCNIPNPVGDIESLVSCRPPQPSSCWYICQHCLVHLGDLARYSRQPRHADSFYRQALSVSPRNGQPYNQLGLLRAARGDRLGAAYYHARGLAVGGPFPPAANNLARTLAAASPINDRSGESEMKSPIKGILSLSGLDNSISTVRLSKHAYINSYIAIHHRLQSGEKLQEAEELVSGLSSTLTALVATDEFDADTIIKMCCLDLYAVFSVTDGHKLDVSALTEDERKVLNLAMELVAGTLAALLLPAHTRDAQEMLPYPALPAVKVLLEWIRLHSDVLKEPSFVSRLQLWPGLCTLLNSLQECIKDFSAQDYETIPLPEDEELQGYLPIDLAFSKLKYTNCASSPLFNTNNPTNLLLSAEGLSKEEIVVNLEKEYALKKKHGRYFATEIEKLKQDKSFINCLRAYRLIELGKWLAIFQKDNGVEYINVSDNDGMIKFTPIQNTLETNPDLLKAIEELSLLREKRLHETIEQDLKISEASSNREDDNLSDTEVKIGHQLGSDVLLTEQLKLKEACIPPPIVISEADFKEKVREKRAGILKPQGSLERAWGEKALSRGIRVETLSPERDSSAGDYIIDTADNQDTGSSSSTVSQDGAICTDISSLLDPLTPKDKEELSSKREGRKSRTNVAMQAIMKKQEESGKQVKFLTPVTTPEIYSNQISPLGDKKKIIQPKAIKSLNFLPTDRKTGGILSLKDKSAGYPHLVNTESTEISKTEIITGEQSQSASEELSNKTSPAAKLHDKSHDLKSNHPGQPVAKYQSSPNKNQAGRIFDVGKNLNEGLIVLNPSSYIPWSNGSPVIRPPYMGDGTQTTDDFQSNRGLNMFGQQNSQSNLPYYTPFNMPDSHHGGITLPVVNPKEIDVRSVALQKQKTAQHGMSGDTMTPMPDHYINHRDPNVAGYNYWYNNQSSPSGPSNPSQGTPQRENQANSPRTNNLPPRLANLYKNKNANQEYGVRMHDQTGPSFRYGSMQDTRNVPPTLQNIPANLHKSQASWVAGSAAPHAPNSWWKPTTGEIATEPAYDANYPQQSFNSEQHYPPNYYGQHSPSQHQRPNLDYQEQKNSPNFGQQNRNANISTGSAQMNSRFNMPFDKQQQQNTQYPLQPPNYYNAPINNFSGTYNQPPGNYGNQNSYSPIMYPQFSSKFGFPQQQGGISKQSPSHIGNPDFSSNPYTSRNVDRFGAISNNESASSDSFSDTSNQFARDLRHTLPSNSANFLSANIPEFVPKHLDLDAAGSTSSSFEGPLTQNESKKDNDPFSVNEPSASGNAIGNTYSLFSGTPQSWGAGVPTASAANITQQSLWSGPGPSPLERLLEQQKQFKYSANE